MVENKNAKREKDIKSKLMAAIAMLLVSSIMMVSTSYAWFTLSTAPEVTGITTNIASNGNLEIALSPKSGVGAEVGNATTGMESVVQKNLTWGNLVDMSDVSYNLGNLTLAPAKLYLTVGGNIKSLSDNVLATPTYGDDGRISALNGRAFIATRTADGKYVQTEYKKDADGNFVDADGNVVTDAEDKVELTHSYGVRAVGSSSGLSTQASALRAARAEMTSQISAAINAASQSLTETGAALAEMMISHAMKTDTGDTYYAKYEDDLEILITKLDESVTNIDKALKAYLTAAVTTIEDETLFEAADGVIDGLSMDDLTVNSSTTGDTTTYSVSITVNNAEQSIPVPALFATAKEARDTIDSNITAAQGKLATLKTSEKKTWTQVSPVLNCLLNTSSDSESVKINGKTMSQIEAMDDNALYSFAFPMLSDATIELSDGSGLYYELAEIVGNIVAVLKGVELGTVSAGGVTLNDVKMERVTIKTVVPSTQTILLPALQAQTAGIKAAASGGEVLLDSYYGYVIDLMVRTNAADTDLMLQTEGVQRVYGDSNSAATMGNGTSFTFKTYNYDQVISLQNLLTSIRVVFFDPTQGENEVLGLARVVAAPVVSSVVVGTEKGEDNVTDVDVVEYTVTGYLELCNIISGTDNDGNDILLTATGACDAGSAKTDDLATDYAENDYLCALTQNQAQPISVMVYLDGENVTSADVLADEAVTGALNLQFRSSTTLEPMANSDLMNMVSYKITRGLGVTGVDKIYDGVNYVFTLDKGYELQSITIDGEAMKTLPTKDENGNYTINSTEIKGDIVVLTKKGIDLKSKVTIDGTGKDGVSVTSALYDDGKIEIVLNGYTSGSVTVQIGDGNPVPVTPEDGKITLVVPSTTTVDKDTAIVVNITAPTT